MNYIHFPRKFWNTVTGPELARQWLLYGVTDPAEQTRLSGLLAADRPAKSRVRTLIPLLDFAKEKPQWGVVTKLKRVPKQSRSQIEAALLFGHAPVHYLIGPLAEDILKKQAAIYNERKEFPALSSLRCYADGWKPSNERNPVHIPKHYLDFHAGKVIAF